MESENVKQVVDAASMVTVIGTLVDVLPAIAAIFTIIWTTIRIFETNTVKNFLKRFKHRKN
tara:strand:+ start:1613 stop:1795 length:183 start_codon:yes stop_codon:yes gene_type:complete